MELPALELGLALLLERCNTFVGVLRHEYTADGLALHGQAEVQRPTEALRDRELRMTDRDAGPGRELSRVLDGACPARGRVGKELVDDAGILCLCRLESRGVYDQVQALRPTDQSGQPLRAARAWEETEVHLGQPDLIRAFGREPQVAGQRQLEPAPQAVAPDRGDEHERRVLQRPKRL